PRAVRRRAAEAGGDFGRLRQGRDTDPHPGPGNIAPVVVPSSEDPGAHPMRIPRRVRTGAADDDDPAQGMALSSRHPRNLSRDVMNASIDATGDRPIDR